MGRPPTDVTTHAVERYIMRHRCGWAFAAARAELLREAHAANYQERSGDREIWRSPSGRLLVVAADGVVISVLPRAR